MKHLGDITKISGYTAPIVDCIIGGSPCQDLSVAGKRAGLDGERSGLYMEQIRIVKEMRKQDERNGRTDDSIRPRYMVWENVPGAFSSNKGEDFRIVLEELAKVKDENAVIPMPDTGKWTNCGCIMGDGWSIAWRVLDAQFWGVPQRRRRIALVADFGGQSAAEILFVRKSLSGNIEPSKPKRKEPSTDASGSFGADDRLGADQYNAVILGDTVSTLGVNCGMSHGRQCVLEPLATAYGVTTKGNGDCFISAERHTALSTGGGQAGQGFPCVLCGGDVTNDRELAKAVYKKVYIPKWGAEIDRTGEEPVCFDEFFDNEWQDDEIREGLINRLISEKNQMAIAYTMQDREGCAGGGKGALIQEDRSASLRTNNFQYLFQPVYSVENHPNDSRVGINEDGMVQALTGRMGTGGGNVPMVLALDRASFNQGKNAQYDFEVSDKGVNSPLVAKGPGAVCYWDGGQVTGTLTANNAGGNQRMPDKENFNCVISNHKTRYIVRRLTPLECERLQGYPDGWTDIGDWTDSNGKVHKTSDAARYKALGNSIALPPWKWVLKRLCACYERDATMASLFDGIGGFPYLWEQLNGKGSCLWASEIEEFPIAVTERRINNG